LDFRVKDVAGGAELERETSERTTEQMVEMGATDDVDSTWVVSVGINIEFPAEKAGADVAQSFGDAWIPRFSTAMQFRVPFDDAPNLPILDGDPNYALLLER
jgi:hypothetical protein